MSLYHFTDLYQSGSKIQHVFPLHQRALLELIARVPDSVQEVWVFGSTLTLRCGQGSDLDVCLVGEISLEETKDLWVLNRIPLDLLLVTKTFFDVASQQKGSIYHQIRTTGLKIWERGTGLQ